MTSTIAIMYAVEIHVISWMLAPSSPRMFGSATLTIDESIVAISEPNAIDTATSHLLTGSGLTRTIGVAVVVTASLRAPSARAGTCRRRSQGRAGDRSRAT